MDFIAQLPLKEPVPLSNQFAMAYVFMCHDSECCPFDPMSGASAVLLQHHSDSPLVGTKYDGKDFGTYPDIALDFTAATEPAIDTADLRADRVLLGQVSSSTKIGGTPFWIQSNEWPDCPDCGGETKFIAQIAAELPGESDSDANASTYLDFGDLGTGYIFKCEDDCSDAGAVFFWQC
jgi:hypothetical protein